MVSRKVDNGRIKGLPYRKQKDVSGLWAGKQVLFTAMIGRDEFTQFSSGECSKFRQVAVCSYFTLPFVLTGKKKKEKGNVFFLVCSSSQSKLQITQAPVQVWIIETFPILKDWICSILLL